MGCVVEAQVSHPTKGQMEIPGASRSPLVYIEEEEMGRPGHASFRKSRKWVKFWPGPFPHTWRPF